MRRVAAVAVVVLGVAGLPSASAQPGRQDYAALALNVLPPGQNGSLVFNRNTRDQAQLYECLTPLFDRVRAEDLRRCFKDASLGLIGQAGARAQATARASSSSATAGAFPTSRARRRRTSPSAPAG